MESYTFALSGDSTINDTVYQKLYAVQGELLTSEFINEQDAILTALLRETSQGQVFFRYVGDDSQEFFIDDILFVPSDTSNVDGAELSTENEYLLYDLSLSVGDTVPYHTRIIESVDSVMIGDQYRKLMTLSPSYVHDMTNYCGSRIAWIEGIGPTDPPDTSFESFQFMFIGYKCSFTTNTDIGTQFRCYHSSTINYPEEYCSLILNTDEQPKQQPLTIFPNPAVRSLYIELNDYKSSPDQIKILDTSGRLVMSQSAGNSTSGPVRLDIEKIPAGVYAVQVSGDNGVIGTTRFIKQ